MPRLAVIDPARASGRVKEIFDGPLKGRAANLFRGMANSPAALDAYLGMAQALTHGMLSPIERESINLAVGQANGCNYCVAAHTGLARRAGLSDDQAMQARRGIGHDPRTDALIKFALALHEKRGHVSDRDLTAVRAAGFTDGHIAEAVALYALCTYTNFFNHVNESIIDFPPVPPV